MDPNIDLLLVRAAPRTGHADVPRGEFIQVQLALEDPRRSAAERGQLRRRESQLLKQHARQWLGDVGRFLVGKWSGPDKPYHYQFVRGWLDHVRVLPFHDTIFPVLARSPQARLLRQLEVVYDMAYHPWQFEQCVEGLNEALMEEETVDVASTYRWDVATVLPPLLKSPHLTNLRILKLGFSDHNDRIGYSRLVRAFEACDAEEIIKLLHKCPLWDVATGKERANLRRHSDLIWGVAFSPDGALVASASGDGRVGLWDAAAGRLHGELLGMPGSAASVAFLPDGKRLVAGTGVFNAFGEVWLWDVSRRKVKHIFKGHLNAVAHVALSRDGATLASVSASDRTVWLWHVPPNQ